MPDNKPKRLPPLSQQDVQRFWSKVVKGDSNECWPWLGGCSKNCYGTLWVSGVSIIATRIAWFLEHGEDPYPLLIRHKCDRPWCCNPNHLLTGTHKENSQDAIDRGRRPTGENHNRAILNNQSVAALLVDRASGMSIPKLCQKYDVSQGAVIPIIKGLTWRHVIGPREKQKKQLTPELRTAIRAKRAAGATIVALAREFGMSVGAIGMLVKNQTWALDPKDEPDA